MLSMHSHLQWAQARLRQPHNGRGETAAGKVDQRQMLRGNAGCISWCDEANINKDIPASTYRIQSYECQRK